MKSAKSEKTLRILISRNSGGAIGGAEMSSVDQASVLSSLGYEVFFVSNLKNLRGKLPDKTKLYSWSSIETPKILRAVRVLYLLPFGFIRAVYLAMKIKPDVINPHSREDQIAFTLTKLIHKKPVVWKNAGDLRYQILPRRNSLLSRTTQRLLESALLRADCVYSLNADDNKYLMKMVGGLDERKLAEIPSSILFANYDKNNKLHAKTNKIVVGTVIRLHKDKGVQDLIRSFNDLYSQSQNIELWIVGDGDYRSELERLARNNKNIKFLGQQENISKYLSSMDIFVQPAYKEPWGRNVVEAKYFGKAIVGSNSGGVAAQIEDGYTGLLYEPGNTKQLTDRLHKLIKDAGLRKKLGGSAQKEVLKKGDFKTIVEQQIIPIYTRLAKKQKLTVDATPIVRHKIDGIGRYSQGILERLAGYYDIELTGFAGDKLNPSLKRKYSLNRLPIPRRLYSFLYKKDFVPEIGSGNETMLCFNFVEFPKSRRKVVLFVHDLAFITHPETLTPKNRRYLQKYVPQSLKRAAKIITVSEAAKQKIAQTYKIKPSKIAIIPPGIDPKQFKPATSNAVSDVLKKYGLPKNYILFFGTLEPRKNITGCIEAFLKLPERTRKKYPLVLAGSRGWQNEVVEERIRNLQKQGEAIHVTGYIDDKDAPVVYSAASVFLFPSFDEGFGIPIIEAMACGTPVLVSDIRVLRETAGNAALFAKPNDPGKIAQHIEIILNDKKAAGRFTILGIERASMFTWEKSALKLKELLLE